MRLWAEGSAKRKGLGEAVGSGVLSGTSSGGLYTQAHGGLGGNYLVLRPNA